ncbi:22806_t:CDS:1, partial [Cetraspora pellucida]
MKNYSNLIEYDDDIFNNNSEEFDKDYISNEDNLNEIKQFDCENLEVTEIIDFNIFSEEQINKINSDSTMESENELDYNINDVINATM